MVFDPCGNVPQKGCRLLLQASLEGGKSGSATFHAVELRSCGRAPQFVRRPPVAEVRLAKPVEAKRVEIRSFLLTADPKLTPSFNGYELDVE